jgi:hypothetical protein
MLDMTLSMLKRTITKYNEYAGNDVETRSLTSYHSTHTATSAGYSSMSEHRRMSGIQMRDHPEDAQLLRQTHQASVHMMAL